MRKILNFLIIGILCSRGLSGCIGIPSSSDGDANDGQEADTILEDRIADLETALFLRQLHHRWKETEIEILLSRCTACASVDGTLESLYASLQSDYQNLSSYSYTANQSIIVWRPNYPMRSIFVRSCGSDGLRGPQGHVQC